MKRYLVLGALLFAAPLFSQDHELLQFRLGETRAQVEQRLGRPAVVADFGDFQSWQYQIGVEDHHEFSHQLVFRHSTGELISVTRSYEAEQSVDALFPESESSAHFLQDSDWGIRARRLDGGRVLLAIGAPRKGQTSTQLLLIRESELPHFYGWVKLPGK